MLWYRRVIRITAEDSPNVKLGLAQRQRGLAPDGRVLVPGVLTYAEYVHRRAVWDKVRQTVGLDARFYEGADAFLFPQEWLDRAERLAATRVGPEPVRWLGIDPAEGGDMSAFAVIDTKGLLDLRSLPTPDTTAVTAIALTLMREHNIPGDRVAFDRGGGGKQHADRLRSQGHRVRTVAFGEVIAVDLKRGMTMFEERRETREDKYVYKNRRAELYGELSGLLDPGREDGGSFALPDKYPAVRQQLAPIPLQYDPEGRLELPPKTRRPGADVTKVTLVDLIGHSPDEADALALACHAMLHRAKRNVATSV